MIQLRNLPRGRLCIDQLERVIRWYYRFQQINEGRQTGASFEGQYDDMLAFFMNCYHLKDWIKNDISDTSLNAAVEDYINQNACLKLCADICNGAKHLNLTHSRFGEGTSIRTEVHLDESLENPPVIRKWYITSDSGQIFDSFDIATQCVQKWVEFFNQHESELNVNPFNNADML
jgi:hypothetical protein